jgi:hypothetical protein
MRPCWRKVAERAEIDAYEVKDVAEALVDAFKSDFKKEVSQSVFKELKKIAEDSASSLFSDHQQRLQSLAIQNPSQPLQKLVIECIQYQLDRSDRSSDPVYAGTIDAAEIWCSRHNKEIEEHSYRAGTHAEGDKIKAKIDEARQSLDVHALAKDICDQGSPAAKKFGKQSGLDEGISL